MEKEIELNDAELDAVEKAEARLAKLEDDGTTDPEIPAAAPEKPESDSTPLKSETVAVPDKKAEPSDDSGTTPPGEVKIPDAYYRAAIHQGWKPEDIDEFVKSNPELANKTLERIYSSTNKISQEFARIGRVKTETPANEPSAVAKLDLTAIEKEYGKEDPGYILIKSLAEQVESLSAKVTKVQTTVPQNTQREEESVLRQSIDGFFCGDDMKLYAEFYGKGKVGEKNRTLEQEERRWNLLEEADKIRDGAAQQGIKMDVGEALGRGHLIVADSFKGQAIRNSIVKELKQKSKGLTLKPKGNALSDGDKVQTETALEAKTAARLAALKL